MVINESPTLKEYKETLGKCFRMYLPNGINDSELNQIIDYSIGKRYKKEKCVVDNSYTKKKYNSNLLAMADYINSKQPIVTAFGTMFMKHADCPNPMAVVIQQFLDQRTIHKDIMLSFPKGSEDYEKYNLLQSLDKIDSNAIYGILGLFTCILFNINVSSSITSQGRALISSQTLFLESFLANNVKFGSLNEVLEFIKNVNEEKRTYNDSLILSHIPTVEEVFAKVVMSCGYRWIPDEDELDVIWRVINNLGQRDLNRLYYKNNLYEFLENESMIKAVKNILKSMKNPLFTSTKVPEELKPLLDEFAYILKEFVYYDKMYIDRIDRCDNMIKSVVMVSDTDSCIVSLDAWYRWALKYVKDEDLQIKKYDPVKLITIFKKDEFGDFINLSDLSPVEFEEGEEHYDFENDEIIMEQHAIDPLTFMPQDYLRYSIINIMAYVIDILLNDYMEKFTIYNHSWAEDRKCKIYSKNEFFFTRLLMTTVKKSYASNMTVQEGHLIPKSDQFDVKGIAAIAKSSNAKSTRDALKEILIEDILTSDTIDQFRVVERLAILEKKIVNSIYDGSKEYYKPVTIKSASSYENPMRIQGIKASVIWNSLKDDDLPGIDLDERNAISVAKVNLNLRNVEKLQKFGKVYDKAYNLLKSNQVGGQIDAIAIPLDVQAPDWLLDIIDYKTIISDNISGFPFESIGIANPGGSANYSNILQL